MIVTNVRLSLLLPQGTNSSEPEIRGTEETPGTFRRGSGGYDVACGLSYCRPVPWNRRVRCSDNNAHCTLGERRLRRQRPSNCGIIRCRLAPGRGAAVDDRCTRAQQPTFPVECGLDWYRAWRLNAPAHFTRRRRHLIKSQFSLQDCVFKALHGLAPQYSII